MTAEAEKTCPQCGEDMLKRLIGAGAGLVFKGSGFYLTDYAKNGKGTSKAVSPAESSSESTSSDSASSSDSPSKPPPKPGSGPSSDKKTT
jgi:predicted nucleic acid-binding Zn ribbon protein